MLSRIHSFPKGTSCCRDGLSAQHLVDMLGGAASATADALLCSITKIINLLLEGKYTNMLGGFIASALLTRLVKLGVVYILLLLVRCGVDWCLSFVLSTNLLNVRVM